MVSSLHLQHLPGSRRERIKAPWSCLVCPVLGRIFFTIIVSHPMETLGGLLMCLNAILPEVIPAAIYQPDKPGVRKEGPRLYFQSCCGFGPVSVPPSPDLTGGDSLIAFILPPYLASLHHCLAVK